MSVFSLVPPKFISAHSSGVRRKSLRTAGLHNFKLLLFSGWWKLTCTTFSCFLLNDLHRMVSCIMLDLIPFVNFQEPHCLEPERSKYQTEGCGECSTSISTCG